MPTDEELELIRFGLQEVKDQNQVLILICSLMITLPISSSLVLQKILSTTNWVIGLFISGIIILIITIILLILSVREMPVRIPSFDDFLDSLGKYKPLNIMKSFMKAYSNNLNLNIKKRDERRYLLKLAEKFIIMGIILMIGTLITAMVV